MPCSLRAFSRPSVRSRPERERRAVPSHVSARSIRSPIFTMLSSRAGAAGLKSANLVDPMPGAQRGVVGRGERRWAVPTGHAEEASVLGGWGGQGWRRILSVAQLVSHIHHQGRHLSAQAAGEGSDERGDANLTIAALASGSPLGQCLGVACMTLLSNVAMLLARADERATEAQQPGWRAWEAGQERERRTRAPAYSPPPSPQPTAALRCAMPGASLCRHTRLMPAPMKRRAPRVHRATLMLSIACKYLPCSASHSQTRQSRTANSKVRGS